MLEDGTVITHVHYQNDTCEESELHHNHHGHATGESDSSSTHTHEDGTIHSHTLGDQPHHHENTKAILNRMNRAIGHMESIKKMVEDGRDPNEVLVQIAAVRSAINNVGKIILEEHINHCILEAVETGNHESLEDLNDAISKFVK